MPKTGCLLLCMLISLISSPPAVSQEATDSLAEFNEILQVNFIAPLRAANITISPELRAKCIAYQLHCQFGLLEEFEADRQAGRRLLEAVRDFVLGASSPGTWTVVENGLQGQYTEEINRLLGGSVYVPPIIPSLHDIVSKRKSLNVSARVTWIMKFGCTTGTRRDRPISVITSGVRRCIRWTPTSRVFLHGAIGTGGSGSLKKRHRSSVWTVRAFPGLQSGEERINQAAWNGAGFITSQTLIPGVSVNNEMSNSPYEKGLGAEKPYFPEVDGTNLRLPGSSRRGKRII